jgi:hypothetical protein
MAGPIEVLIDAGLGNQMFQYAMGRSLSIRTGRPLVLDTSPLFLEPGWGFDLACFRLGQQRVRNLPYAAWRVRAKSLRVLASLGIEVTRFVKEPTLQFSEDVLRIRKACILEGYWQSERYFESISDQLREEFTFIREQDPRSAACQASIRRANSIGLHARRCDYATPDGEAYHGTCPKSYYDAAIELVLSRLGSDAELFVFSDDMDWARHNIRYALPTTFVDWNSGRSYEDLRLMSSCRALIMANSSFSWWAGWLIPGPGKVVVAPRQWYRAPGVISDLPDSPWLKAI